MTIFSAELYDALAPLAWDDANQSYALRDYLTAIAAEFDQVSEVVHDQADGTPGWCVLLEPASCPAWALDWLACLSGVALPAGATDAQKRSLISAASARNRGTPAALIAATQATLTGGQHVVVSERYGGDAYALHVVTWASETADTAATQKAILSQKPAGIVLTYTTTATGWDFNVMATAYASFTTAKAAFATFTAMLGGP